MIDEQLFKYKKRWAYLEITLFTLAGKEGKRERQKRGDR